MARYLARESTPEEVDKLEKLVEAHPELKSEFEFFRDTLYKKQSEDNSTKPVEDSFDNITRRLKNDGAL